MRRFLVGLFFLLSLPSVGMCQSLLSVPGLADAVAEGAKNSHAIGIVDLDGKLSAGAFLPIRMLHDSAGVNYLAIGPGGVIKQGENMKGGIVTHLDITAITRKLEGRSAWYQAHVSTIKLPSFWLGPSILPPLNSSFTWRKWKSWIGMSISVGF